jgi:hypothetical protein
VPPCQGIPRAGIVPHQDRADGLTETIRVRVPRSGAAIPPGLLCWTASLSRTDSAKENVVWGGIFVLARTRKYVLLRTRDVRQTRRTVSGDEEGTRNGEQQLLAYPINRPMTSPLSNE